MGSSTDHELEESEFKYATLFFSVVKGFDDRTQIELVMSLTALNYKVCNSTPFRELLRGAAAKRYLSIDGEPPPEWLLKMSKY